MLTSPHSLTWLRRQGSNPAIEQSFQLRTFCRNMKRYGDTEETSHVIGRAKRRFPRYALIGVFRRFPYALSLQHSPTTGLDRERAEHNVSEVHTVQGAFRDV